MTDLSAAEPPKAAANPYTSPHVMAAGAAGISLTQALADCYDWILNWPVHSPTAEQCLSLAVLTVAFVGGGGFAIFGRKKS